MMQGFVLFYSKHAKLESSLSIRLHFCHQSELNR